MHLKVLRLSGVVLFYFGWGTYYVLLRPRFVDLGATYFQILLIDSIPALIALSSILWGRLADLISRRAFLAISAFGGIVIAFLGFFDTVPSLLILLAILSIFGSMALPVINTLFSFESEVEASFASYLFAEATGWMLSGLFIGYLAKTPILMRIGYTIGGICWILGILILLYILRHTQTGETVQNSHKKLGVGKNLMFLLCGVFFVEFGIIVSYGILSVKLYESLGKSKFLYGLVWSTLPSFASVVVSNAYGGIIKKISPWNSLVLISLLYFVNVNILSHVSGIFMALFWILPLWNFLHIAIYSAVAKVSDVELRSSAFGLVNAVLNLAMVLSFSGGILSDRFGQGAGLSASYISIFVAFVFFYLLKLNVEKTGI
ncbi:MAG TPA: MFS transporter [Candidatus Hydrothermia bacterium]|nr:MFS transporter [Candidatus Hydrothermia bacterium]MDD5572823.1 MFS transporter [Candidatus Hydrothermia bacterium]HRD23163.1 MFS transporter [Candidatus Hydrothermia bacterium]